MPFKARRMLRQRKLRSGFLPLNFNILGLFNIKPFLKICLIFGLNSSESNSRHVRQAPTIIWHIWVTKLYADLKYIHTIPEA